MRLPTPLARLLPDLGEVSVTERIRASVGAMLGLLVTGFVSRAALGTTDNLPLLIAPMGASAVLLFAVPSSPLAQPWSILGGNVVSALIGVAAARLISDPLTAAAVGGSLAIAAMMLLRCLHPPSGAVALTAVLGGPAIRAAGFGFVVWPVGLNSILLLVVALAFNNVTGRRYPHRPAPKATVPLTTPDAAVRRVLRRHGEVVDIGQHDLAVLLEEIEMEIGDTSRCAALMHPEPDALQATAALDDALDRMAALRRNTMPVVDATGRFVGLVAQSDLVRHLRPTPTGRQIARLFRRSIRFDLTAGSLGDAAANPVRTALSDTPVSEVLDAMLASGADYCPILDEDRRLIGAITSTDLLHWLAWRGTATPAYPSSVIQRL